MHFYSFDKWNNRKQSKEVGKNLFSKLKHYGCNYGSWLNGMPSPFDRLAWPIICTSFAGYLSGAVLNTLTRKLTHVLVQGALFFFPYQIYHCCFVKLLSPSLLPTPFSRFYCVVRVRDITEIIESYQQKAMCIIEGHY